MTHQKRGSRLLAIVLVTALFVSAIGSALAGTFPYETISMDSVNMRSRANTTSTILKRIKAGDRIKVLSVSGNFYSIQFDGKTGYALKKYIDGTDPSPDPSPDPSLTMQAPPAVMEYPYDTTLKGFVKLRKTAKETGEVYKTLSPDEIVTVYSLTDNGFAKVKCGGTTGYVLASYVVLADIATPAPKATATPNPDAQKYTELKKGSAGNEVIALQQALIELGYLKDKPDGKLGTQTEAALKAMQKRNGLKQTGIADQALQFLLYEGKPKNPQGYRKILKTVAPVAGATIRSGSVGAAVERMQGRLKELGYYIGDVTGTCDKETVAALKAFEAKHGLEINGEANAADQAVLFGATAMSVNTVVTPAPTPTLAPPTETLRRGDKGEGVKTIQQRLFDMGYYKGRITGTFNEDTEKAIKAFQTKSKLKADGVCGPQTRTVLFGVNAIYAVPTAMPLNTPQASIPPITEDNVIIILSGSRGEAVLRLQKRLQELGYYVSRMDGVYLTEDIAAVRAFQSASGLKVDGKAGFQTQSMLYSDTAIRGSAIGVGTVGAVLRYGSKGVEVTTLQNRLIELGYLAGQADGNFGISTKTALMSFQKASNLSADGIAGAKTLTALNANNATSNKVTNDGTLKVGSVSAAVKELQDRLIALGYLSTKADGKFGVQTSLALIAFQKANGLTADGMAGSKTINKLNGPGVISANGSSTNTNNTGAPDLSNVNLSPSNVRYANWYTEIKSRCRMYPNATVYDFTSGISWQVNMFSLGAHADSEPITATDTANMIRAFGGKNTWTPKAVWVIFSDGRIYMASTHDMPHEVSHIRNNNFDGHLCIHFPRTQSQVESIGPYATSHQKAIDLGWAATLKRAGQ
ncbi:MAG: peptidoglycan-binding protein [Clostridia bacterium]